jgi:acetyl-CoA carboxylase biotin carboxyl carrier protein
MIDLEFLERLIQAIDQSGIDSVEIERGGTRVRIAKSPAGRVEEGSSVSAVSSDPYSHTGNPLAQDSTAVLPPHAPGGPASVEAPSDLIEVTSPMVGTFYRAPSPEAPPYVEVGQRVAEGDTLCIIEAMKLMNELESEVGGTVSKVLVGNAEPVEYGQVLFLIEPP